MGKEGLKLKESVSLRLYNKKGELKETVSSPKKEISKLEKFLLLLRYLEGNLG